MKLTKDDFDLRVVEFDSGIYLNTSMDSLEQATELTKQILDNQKLREEIVDLADIWDGPVSIEYGHKLQYILDKLDIKDIPKFYEKENIDKLIEEITAKRND